MVKTEHKAVGVVGFKVIDEAELIVEALVSVTGIEDEVKDVIEPTAYEKTLAARIPKGVWSHDWDTPVSKTLASEELLPGDSRLPAKQRNGEDWPKEAGALLVRTQFNGETQRGREAYADVKFYGDEAEWSIGYSVPVGGAKIDPKTGVRHIKTIDLFEYSPVLFGAMPLTVTMGSVKDAQEAWKSAPDARLTPHEFKAIEGDDPEAADAADHVCELCGTVQAYEVHGEAKNADETPDPELGDKPAVEGEPKPEGEPSSEKPDDLEKGDKPAPKEDDTPEPANVVVALDKDGSLDVTITGSEADPEAVLEAVKAFLDKDGGRSLGKKVYIELPGSFEQRRCSLREALQDWADDFFPSHSWPWAYPEATYDDHSLFSVYVEGGGDDWDSDDDIYFDVEYTYDPETNVTTFTNEPIQVVVQGVIVAKGVRADRNKALIEAKVGRVLSSGNSDTMIESIASLIGILDSAGVEHPFTVADDTNPDDTPVEATVVPASTTPAKSGEGMVELDADFMATIHELKAVANPA